MGLGDPGEALRAQAQLAKRHAEQLCAEAARQQERARTQCAADEAVAMAAWNAAHIEADALHCPRCNAVWRSEAVKEAMRLRPGCLLCGGPLTPVP
jgi:hypothetical protein